MLRFFGATALAVALLGVTATAAPAHQGNPNFRSQVRHVTPAQNGLDVRVVNYDDSLELFNKSGKDVIVEGYRNEPFVRISADGTVAVNTRSPSGYLNDDRYAVGVQVPKSADSKAPPQWQTIDKTGRYTWHDHRIHWMARTVPPQVKDKGKRTKVFDWRVPVRVGGRPAAVQGTLTWVGKQGGGFPVAAGLVGALLIAAGLAVIGLARRRRGPGGGGGPAKEAAPVKEAW